MGDAAAERAIAMVERLLLVDVEQMTPYPAAAARAAWAGIGAP